MRFVAVNYGESELARRFGVTRYPAIFVDDVLVATPKDFGFYGKGEGSGEGRYAPLKSAESHERFRADLRRVIDLIQSGRKEQARAEGRPASGGEVMALPEVSLVDLDGRPITRADLAGKITLVEFWATWCPPCRGTLGWLAELKRRHGDDLVVLAVAVESEELDVRKLRSELGTSLRFAMGTPEFARALGDVSVVPTLLVFDRDGRRAGSFYGAPPTLHNEAEALLARLRER